MEYYEILERACNRVEIAFDKDKYNKFLKYMHLIKMGNTKTNLTRITEDDEIIKKHFIDSINLFQFKGILKAKNLIDIGTGAGLPGIPVKILMPELEVTLLDSLNKRVVFLNDVINELGLTGISAIHKRAEEASREIKHRECYDIAVSRAVANLASLSEYCLPFVKKDGFFIALKGPKVESEIIDGEKAISELGGRLYKVQEVEIEDTDLKHNLVIVKKEKNTDKIYPRNTKNVVKNPIK